MYWHPLDSIVSNCVPSIGVFWFAARTESDAICRQVQASVGARPVKVCLIFEGSHARKKVWGNPSVPTPYMDEWIKWMTKSFGSTAGVPMHTSTSSVPSMDKWSQNTEPRACISIMWVTENPWGSKTNFRLWRSSYLAWEQHIRPGDGHGHGQLIPCDLINSEVTAPSINSWVAKEAALLSWCWDLHQSPLPIRPRQSAHCQWRYVWQANCPELVGEFVTCILERWMPHNIAWDWEQECGRFHNLSCAQASLGTCFSPGTQVTDTELKPLKRS